MDQIKSKLNIPVAVVLAGVLVTSFFAGVGLYNNQAGGDQVASPSLISPGLCGNGVINLGEQCDNSAQCGAGGPNCPFPKDPCSGDPCAPQNSDGCSATCQIEPGWTCTGQPSVCTPPPPILNLTLTGFIPGVGTAQGMALSENGNTLYVGSSQFGVVKFDVTQPNTPVLVTTSHLLFGGGKLAVSDNRIVSGGGAVIIDQATFGSDDEIWDSLSCAGQDFAIHENIGFAACGSAGLFIFDMTDAGNVSMLATVPIFARGVALSDDGQYAFVAAGTTGLKIVDVSNPSSPVVIATLDPPGNNAAGDIEYESGIVYIADGVTGLSIINVTNPAAPVLLSTHPIGGGAQYVTQQGGLAVISGNSALAIINVTNPSSPQTISTLTTGFYDLALRNNILYASNANAGFSIYNLSNPASPQLLTTVNSPFAIRNAVASNGLVALVGGSQATVKVVDVNPSNPNAPVQVAAIGAVAQDIAMYNNLAFIACGSSCFRIYDISNPAAPVFRSNTAMFARGVALSQNGQRAFVAAGTTGLKIVNVSNPVSPVILGTIDTPGNAQDVVINADETLAYVTDGTGGVKVISISNPASPTIVGSVSFSGPTAELAIGDDWMAVSVVGDATAQLAFLSLANPTSPTIASGIGGLASGIEIFEDRYVVSAIGDSHIQIFDLLDIYNPVYDNYDPHLNERTPGRASSIVVSGNRAFAGDEAAILDVLDLYN